MAKWLGISLAIFVCLLFISHLVEKREIKNTSVQQAYDELALALDRAGILPGVGEGEMFTAFAGQTLDKSKLIPPSHGAFGGDELSLGTVLTANLRQGSTWFIELKPGNYKQLKPGALRRALKKINRLTCSQQLAQFSGSATSTSRSFTVTVCPSGVTYSISPGFIKEQCTSLVFNKR